MTSDSTPHGADVPDDLSSLIELMNQHAPAPVERVRAHPLPGRAYVSVAAATRETLRAFMVHFHKTIGVYGLPFAVDPDPTGCVMCREAMTVLQTTEGAFEASLPTEVLTRLDGQTRRLFDREFTAYRIHPSECGHVFVLSVPDTLRFLLDPICEQVTVHDDTHLGRWLSEPEDLTPVLTADDLSRAQFAAIGLDSDHTLTRAAILTDVRHVTHMQVPAHPDTLSLSAEVPTATADLGDTDGELTWTTEHPVRVRNATRNTWYANSTYTAAECTTLIETSQRLTFTYSRNPHDPDACTLRVEASHDPHMVRRTRYLDGDTATFGPWWRPAADDQFSVELDATCAFPAQHLTPSAALDASLTLRHGYSLHGRVEDRALKANPWTGQRYWSLTLTVAETPHDALYLRVLCPHTEGQQIRRGDYLALPDVQLAARLVP